MAIPAANTALSAEATLFGCVFRPNTFQAYHALRCVQSLRWFGGTCSQARFVVVAEVPCDAVTRDRFASYGAEVWDPPGESGLGQAPKSWVLEYARQRGFQLAVVLDPNTLILRDPGPYLAMDKVQAAGLAIELISAADLCDVYDRLGVAVPANWQTTTIDRRRLPPCFSGGVVTVPHAMFDQLRSFWLECIGRMEPQAQAVLERFPRLRMPAPALFAWLGLSLAIAGSGLPWDYLPREMDCPASYFTKIRQFDPDPVICRYVPEPPGSRIGNWVHHCQPHLDSRLQRGIDRLNARLYEERELPGHEWERETLLGEPYGLRPTWNGAADRTARGDEPAPPDDDLRIMIAATPRTGNNWLTQLLSKMYDLPLLPGTEDADALERIDDPRFVFYSHFQPTAAVLRWAQRRRVTVVTLTRNPADVFLSLYEFINAMHRNKLGEQITSRPVYQKLIGNALDSEEVYHHLQHHFDEIQTSVLWILSGKARVVRYEELNQRPEAVLAELCDRIRPVPPERIREIVEACSKEKMRRQGLFMEVIVRRGAVGEGLQRLTPRHLQCIREKYADELAILGYSL